MIRETEHRASPGLPVVLGLLALLGLAGLFVVNPNEAKVVTLFGRYIASGYPYDAHTPGEIALSSHPVEVAQNLLRELQERLGKAGVEVLETRLSHLAYAPEIASAMLQRQLIERTPSGGRPW